MRSELRLRILSGIVLAAVVLVATWLGGPTFRVLAAAISLLVYYEWSTITRLPETDFRANAFGWLSVVLVAALVLFGFDEARFEQIAAQHVMLGTDVDPYTVLGLSHDAPPEEVRRVYRLLVAEHHPDRLIAKGVPEDLIDVATARMSAINLAYQAITKPRPQPLLT